MLSKLTVFVLLFTLCASFTSSQANAIAPSTITENCPTQFVTVGEATYLTIGDMFTVADGHSAMINGVINDQTWALSVTNETYQVRVLGILTGFYNVSVVAQDDLGNPAICHLAVVISDPVPVIPPTLIAPEQTVEVGEQRHIDSVPFFQIAPSPGDYYELTNLDIEPTFGALTFDGQLTVWGKEEVGDYHLQIQKFDSGSMLKEKLNLTIHVVPTLIAKGHALSAYGFTPGNYFLVPKDKVPSPSLDPATNATYTEAFIESISDAVLNQTGSFPAALDIRSPLKTGAYVLIYKTELNYSLNWQIRNFNFRVVDFSPPDTKIGIADIVKYFNNESSNATDLTGDGVFDFTDISALLQLVEGNDVVRVLPFVDPVPVLT